MKLTKAIARKVLEVVDAGLANGLGNNRPGEMCIEAAVCYALDLPHGDNPPCVGAAVRSFKITLNDARWSSNQARAEGMRKLAVAQLGSDTIDQKAFGELVFLHGTQRLMSYVLRECADDPEVKPEHAEKFRACATECEGVKDFAAAKEAVKYVSAYASASASASAYAYASASAYASVSVSAYASAYAYASAPAYAYASAPAYFQKHFGDELLVRMANVALDALIELKSPGCAWLDLCEVGK